MRHGAAFAALGAGGDAQQRMVAVAVDVGDGESGELADSRPAVGQEVDDGDVSRGPRRAYVRRWGSGRRGHQLVDVLAAERVHDDAGLGTDSELGASHGFAVSRPRRTR